MVGHPIGSWPDESHQEGDIRDTATNNLENLNTPDTSNSGTTVVGVESINRPSKLRWIENRGHGLAHTT